MRRTWTRALVPAALLVSTASMGLRANASADAKAAEVMKQAHEALGGEQKLGALKGLSLRADFRRELAGPALPGGGGRIVIMGGGGSFTGDGQVTGSIAIDVLFPDRFYSEETTTSGIQLTRVDGFDGDRPFLDISSNSPGTRVMADRPSDDPARARAALKRTHTDLARLLLGLVGNTHAKLPATYTYAGKAESDGTTADVIDVAGPDDFKARLFIDTVTHLPLMLTFVEPEARPVRMTMNQPPHEGPVSGTSSGGAAPRAAGAGGAALPPGALDQLTPEQRAELEKQIQAAQPTPPRMIEYRMFFADYRDVNGVMLPHQISRATPEKTVEEWDVKEFKVNPKIKADRFNVGAK